MKWNCHDQYGSLQQPLLPFLSIPPQRTPPLPWATVPLLPVNRQTCLLPVSSRWERWHTSGTCFTSLQLCLENIQVISIHDIVLSVTRAGPEAHST